MNMTRLMIAAFLFCTLSALAQTTPPAQPMPPAMNCEAMMKQMHEGMKAMDDRLQPLVEDMNKARGSARIDKTAAVLNELIAQRTQMRTQMMQMMPQMMGHMMEHMQSGMMKGAAGEMKSCPMTQGQTPAPHGH